MSSRKGMAVRAVMMTVVVVIAMAVIAALLLNFGNGLENILAESGSKASQNIQKVS